MTPRVVVLNPPLVSRPETRIVAFTAQDTPDAQFDVMRAGAVAFLLNGVRNEEILATIRKAAASAPGRPQG